MKKCLTIDFKSYEASVPEILDVIGLADSLTGQQCILIKPNLVNMSAPPVTLPVTAVRAIVNYCRQHTDAQIIIAEGTGEPNLTTWDVFREHGYQELAEEKGLRLMDLNDTELVELRHNNCSVFTTFMMPKILMNSFVISAATLKAHSLAKVTLSMKNMIGVAPPAYYQRGGYWRKSAFHEQMHTSVFELNLYRKPDFAFIDGSVGLADHHLGGPTCEPPVAKLIAGFDPVAVDAKGAGLLGVSWKEVGHIRMAHGVLGIADSGCS